MFKAWAVNKKYKKKFIDNSKLDTKDRFLLMIIIEIN